MTSKTFVVGQYSTSGDYSPYTERLEVHRFGSSLRDSDGFPWAVLDEYGDWVSPTLHKYGVKSKIEVVTEPDSAPQKLEQPCE